MSTQHMVQLQHRECEYTRRCTFPCCGSHIAVHSTNTNCLTSPRSYCRQFVSNLNKWGVVIATQLALSTKDVSTSSQCCLNRNCPLSSGENDNFSISSSKTFPMSKIWTCFSQKFGQNLFSFFSKIFPEYILWICPQDTSFRRPHLNLHCFPQGE